MTIIVHQPQDSESIAVLQKRMAVIHSEAVMRRIDELSCSKEQKIKLCDAILKTCLRGDTKA